MSATGKLVYLIGAGPGDPSLIGVRGATYGINPDVVVALDTTIAGDTPEFKAGEAPVDMGKGPVLVLKDGGQVINKRVKDWIKETARKESPFS